METKKLQSFKDLNVWQKSSDLAVLVYKTTERFLRSELYGLTNQLRRAVISISSNIAEGFKRNHKKEKLQFYNIAYGSAAELESQIEISYKLGYLAEQDYQKLILLTIEVAKMLDGLIKSINKFPKSYILNSIFFFIFLYSIFYILTPTYTFAAVLYFDPAEGNYYQGDTFIVDLRIDAEEECVNTVEANLGFSQDILEAIDFSTGNSILSIWMASPFIEQSSGTISFIGGIPGGYCGVLPGDPGKSNLLGKIIFQVKKDPIQQEPKITKVQFLDSSKVLLNDGSGTQAQVTLKDAVFTILSGIPKVPLNQWQEELEKDTIPPESFEIEINKDPSIFDGKYFIAFQTQDKQSGIDYYEIQEGKRDWKRGDSPYLLEDQGRTSIIKVKAVDKAGNERIIEKESSKKPIPWTIIIVILISAGIGYLLYKKLKWSHSKQN